MPIDLLKIDASFVQTMATDEKNRRIVETILALGKNLGVEVIAEGVETAQQAQVLTRLGCCYVQGHLFSEAVDGDAAVRMVESDASFMPAGLKISA
jgi:EAL domain-containing protein (putative c-di-GMP-specific phosphodiesterase class I)